MKNWESFRDDTVARQCHGVTGESKSNFQFLGAGWNFNLGFYMVELLHN